MRNPDNVAEFAGTMDSTAVAEQQNQSLLPETDWPGMKGILSKHTGNCIIWLCISNNITTAMTL